MDVGVGLQRPIRLWRNEEFFYTSKCRRFWVMKSFSQVLIYHMIVLFLLLSNNTVEDVSCGYGHTAAITG